MATYAIGDVQGCYQTLLDLLTKIDFNENNDYLWFAGDLVNRGPRSLETLRFIKSLGSKHKVVLGNHDLHCLAVAHGQREATNNDTLDDILQAEDKQELMDWLAQQTLLHHCDTLGYTMVHAGIAPQWDLQQAKTYAQEIENILQSRQRNELLKSFYGNEPSLWQEQLQGPDRWRCLVNHFTRMRLVKKSGALDLDYKGQLNNKPDDEEPWYQHCKVRHVIFGHWAALEGQCDQQGFEAIDTGCIWGNTLTAFCIENKRRISVPFND